MAKERGGKSISGRGVLIGFHGILAVTETSDMLREIRDNILAAFISCTFTAIL